MSCPSNMEKSNACAACGLRALKRSEPFNERSDTLFQGRVWSKADSTFQVGAVGRRFENVTGLHRQKFADRRPANSVLDQPYQFGHFHGLAVADIIKEPRGLAPRGLARAIDCWIWPRRLGQKS